MAAQGLGMVRHGQEASYYEELLAGNLSAGEHRRRARGLQLQADVEPGEQPPSLRGREAQGHGRGHALVEVSEDDRDSAAEEAAQPA